MRRFQASPHGASPSLVVAGWNTRLMEPDERKTRANGRAFGMCRYQGASHADADFTSSSRSE